MVKKSFNFLQGFLLGFDLLTLNVLFISAYWILDRIPDNFFAFYVKFGALLNGSWIFVSWAFNLYNEETIGSFESFSRRTIRIYIGWLCLGLLYLFFLRQFQISRIFTTTCLAGYGLVLVFNRIAYLFAFYLFRKSKHLTRNVLIVGYNNMSKKVVEYLESDLANTHIIGFCEEPKNVTELTNYPVISKIETAIRTSHALHVDEIYSTIAPEQDPRIYKLMKQADQECVHFKIVPDLTQFINRSVNLSYLKDLPVLSTRKEPLDEYGNKVKKRVFDVIVSFLAIVFVLSWLIPILGLLIITESYGPIFFVQDRTGINKRSFRCLKFRSMRLNEKSDLLQASKDDDRLTRMGKLIRRLSLDEFPQFINVFKGDMSIVGPRPHMLKHTEDYSRLIEQYMVRQFVKPGITGWAQVNGFRGETKTLDQMQQRVEHDLWYMENWSLWLDVRIIFLTVWHALRGEKNAF